MIAGSAAQMSHEQWSDFGAEQQSDSLARDSADQADQEIERLTAQQKKEAQINYSTEFHVHGKIGPKGNFPFHSYLQEHYSKISLHEQMGIFEAYFSSSISKFTLHRIRDEHLQLLNTELALFAKTPPNPVLFVRIQPWSQSRELLIISNYYGELIYYGVIADLKKRSTLMLQIRRKIKGKPFFIIKDNGNVDISLINKKMFHLLSKSIKFLYFIQKVNFPQAQTLISQFFQNSSAREAVFNNKEYKVGVFFKNLENFCAYDLDPTESDDVESLKTVCQSYLTHFNNLVAEQISCLQKVRQVPQHRRIILFDFMFVNYIKSTSRTPSNFAQQVQKISSKYIKREPQEIQQERDHFPSRMICSRRCKYCEIFVKSANKKSKYRCLGCSKRFQTDIPLCIGCWGAFHQEVLPFLNTNNAKQIKMSFRKYVGQKADKDSLNGGDKKQEQKCEDVYALIGKIDSNMAKMEQMMDEIQREEVLGLTIVKSINEVIFKHIVDCFNQIVGNCQDGRNSTGESHTK